LIKEESTEVLAVGKYLVLQGKKCAPGVHQVEAGKFILKRYLLSAEMLLNGEWKICSTLYRGIVCNNHAGAALDHPDSGYHTGSWAHSVVEIAAGELRYLKEGGAWIY